MDNETNVATEKELELEAQVKALKESITKLTTENAGKKREIQELAEKYKSTLSESEQKELARNEEFERLKAENEGYKKERDLADHKAKFLSVGYDEELAQKSAEAMVNGDITTVIASIKVAQEMREKKMEAELLGRQPGLSTGKPLEVEDPNELSDEDYYKKYYRRD